MVKIYVRFNTIYNATVMALDPGRELCRTGTKDQARQGWLHLILRSRVRREYFLIISFLIPLSDTSTLSFFFFEKDKKFHENKDTFLLERGLLDPRKLSNCISNSNSNRVIDLAQ